MDLFQQQMNRKDEHVGHANQQYRAASAPEFVETRFVHRPFTTVDVADVSLQTKLAGLTFDVPFFINAITGGSPLTTALNQRLAILARETGMAMATGSMSIAMKFPESTQSFKVIRQENPNGILFANLGAHYDAETAKRAIDIIEANAIQIHVNRAQELVMPEGDRVFSNWLKNIEEIVKASAVPVIVKEVGFGFSREAIAQLESIGVSAIDISGTGGTNFAKIENGRRKEDKLDFLEDWGQTTLTSLMEAQGSRTPIIASGGVKTPLDMAKCFALGASLVGLSGEMLHLIRKDDSLPDAIHTVQTWKEQLTTILTLVGADSISSLQQAPIVVAPSLQNWCDARGIDWKHLAQR